MILRIKMLKRLDKGFEQAIGWHRLSWVFLAIGIVLRLLRYFQNPSLWMDEVSLSTLILQLNSRSLIEPLPFTQQAPVGFLLAERLFVSLFGSSEFALRFFPLVCGVLSLFVLLFLLRKVCTPEAANLAMLFFAIGEWPVYFSSEVKPYSGDLLLALCVVLLAVHVIERRSLLRMSGFALAGVMGTWFSFPIVFVLCGAGLVVSGHFLGTRDWPRFRLMIVVVLLWVVAFAANWRLFIRPVASQTLTDWFVYNKNFAPGVLVSLEGLYWYPRTLLSFVTNPGGLELAGLGTLLAIFGAAFLWKTKRTACCLLAAPLLVTLGASTLKKYPFVDRLVLFLVPFLIVFAAVGLEWLWRELRPASVALSLLPFALLVFHPAAAAARHALQPRSRDEIKPLIRVLNSSFEKDDALYVYNRTWPAFTYYRDRRGLILVQNAVRGRWVPGPSLARELHHHEDLLAHRGKPRVWFLLTHFGDEEQHILGVLDSIGLRLKTHKTAGGSLYLYDLSERALTQPDP